MTLLALDRQMRGFCELLGSQPGKRMAAQASISFVFDWIGSAQLATSRIECRIVFNYMVHERSWTLLPETISNASYDPVPRYTKRMQL